MGTGLIPESFIQELIARTDLVDIIHSRVPLKKTGANFSACCPFHQEKTPSFTVNPQKRFYYCFGCGAGGDAIAFLRNFESLDFVQAVEKLAQQAAMEVPKSRIAAEASARQQNLYALMEKVSICYQNALQSHQDAPLARQYLQQRGIGKSLCERFGLGYAPTQGNYLLEHLGTAQSSTLEELGLMLKPEPNGRYCARFRGRIMFPIRSPTGQLVGFGGRAIQPQQKPKYLNSPETSLFHKTQLLYGLFESKKAHPKLSRLLVVEGYLDVLTLAQAGIQGIVATLGTACTQAHIALLFRHAEEIIFCFDGDEAGHKAARQAMHSTLPHMEAGRSVSFFFLPTGEDPDSWLRKVGKKVFEEALQKEALELADYFFQELEKGLNLDTLNGRNRIVRRAAESLRPLKADAIYTQMLLHRLAKITQVRLENLQGALFAPCVQDTTPKRKPIVKSASPQVPAFRQEPTRSSANTVVSVITKAIRLVMQAPELAELAPIEFFDLDLSSFEDGPLLVLLLKELRQQPLTPCYLLGQWYGTAQGHKLCELTQIPLPESLDLKREMQDCLQKIQENLANIAIKKLVFDLQKGGHSYRDTKIQEEIRKIREKMAKKAENSREQTRDN